MARLWQTGFELNSTSSGVEWTTTSSTCTISSSVVRSGTYSGRSTPTGVAASVFAYTYLSAATQGVYFYRVYINIATLPASAVKIIDVGRFNAGFESNIAIKLSSTGTLQLFNIEDNAQIGSDSGALTNGIWYRVEMKVDTTTLASTAVEGKIDGTAFASGTANLADANDRVQIGGGSAVAMDMYIDDVAINDSSGSFQNSYPGAGKIIHLRPNADGDNSGFTGSDLDSINNYLLVDEATPNDATDTVGSSVQDTIDDYNIDATPNLVSTDDTINCVAVGVRFQAALAGLDSSFALRIKASAGGTVEESSNISPTTTTWFTNTIASPANYPLVLYDLPGASTTAWTKANLDAAQIGMRITVTGTNADNVSAIWLSVDYTPLERAVGVYYPYKSL